ncbi:MAG: hypothetical protein ACYCQJ_00725 [Nitrososphaerales archaeon]
MGCYKFSNPYGLNQPDESVNNATLNAFKYVESLDNPNFKLAIMVDAFSTSLSQQSYGQVYSYIESNFYSRFSNIVFSWEGKPLLCWFNPLDPFSQNSANTSFTNRVVGNNPYVNWIFWMGMNGYQASKGTENPASYEGNPNISSDGVVSITPRFDDHVLYPEGRSGYMIFDQNYTLDLYQEEWNYVLDHRASVSLVLIYSWNEYHERSAIEPHYDSTASVGPFYLLNTTQYFVSKLG